MSGLEPEFIMLEGGANLSPSSSTKALEVVDIGELKYQLMREFDIDMLENSSAAIGVKTEDDARGALSMALQARKLETALDKSRAEIVKPHFDYQKAINKLVKDFKDKLVQIEESLHKKINVWMDEQKDNPFTAVDRLEVEDGSLTTKKSYDFVVEDERLVPLEFKMIDAGAIEKAIKFGTRNIPGVKIVEKTETALRVKN